MSDEQITIPCPRCGRPMTERLNRVNGSTFMGCEGFAPGLCSHTEKVPEFLRMKRAGATQLPGFDGMDGCGL